MPSRFLMELGYNPYEASEGAGSIGYGGGYGVGSLGYSNSWDGSRDEDGDGFKDFTDEDFGESDFDPFPDDGPVFE